MTASPFHPRRYATSDYRILGWTTDEKLSEIYRLPLTRAHGTVWFRWGSYWYAVRRFYETRRGRRLEYYETATRLATAVFDFATVEAIERWATGPTVERL